MRATYVGGHELTKQGKDHPQAPPLHLHFAQFESFIVERGAVGTSTTYEVLDTVHTVSANYPQAGGRPALSPAVPSRTADGVTEIPSWKPHKFWPVAPDHPFWSTDEGREYEASLPNGRHSIASSSSGAIQGQQLAQKPAGSPRTFRQSWTRPSF
ncbi:uncharacterized protein BDW70DRAFT_158398 [Aspergillus foveolatus]|uniref:uncharacterized protein n=1 Tax=Aspergillus foveolatus TaxID=210207 RepID=UPI003CCD0CC2